MNDQSANTTKRALGLPKLCLLSFRALSNRNVKPLSVWWQEAAEEEGYLSELKVDFC